MWSFFFPAVDITDICVKVNKGFGMEKQKQYKRIGNHRAS